MTRVAAKAYQVAPRPKRAAALGIFLGLVVGDRADVPARGVRHACPLGGRDRGGPRSCRCCPGSPQPPRKLASDDGLVMLAKPSGPQAEAFRILRTNIEFSLLSGRRPHDSDHQRGAAGGQVDDRGESRRRARRGADGSVALVDLDLRRPYLNRFFRLPTTPGITDVALGRVDASGGADPDRSRHRPSDRRRTGTGTQPPGSAAGRSTFSSPGPLPPDPGEFVGTSRLSEILNRLRAGLRPRRDRLAADAPGRRRDDAEHQGRCAARRQPSQRAPALDAHRAAASARLDPDREARLVVTGAESDRKGDYGYGYATGTNPTTRR